MLSVHVLSRLFRRLFLEKLVAAHDAGRLSFFNDLAPLADRDAFDAHLTPVRKLKWVVYAKPPFGGPEAVLAYLSRYTHRVAIGNSRLVAFDGNTVSFKWKDYRAPKAKGGGRERYKTMTVGADEFVRRFLIHVLPDGFHRIRHYGLFANGGRVRNITRARELLRVPAPVCEADDSHTVDAAEPPALAQPCPCCGGRMVIVETFERAGEPRAPPTAEIRIGAS